MDPSTSRRPRHRLTWLVVLLGLVEIAAIVAFLELKGVASAVCSATGVAHVPVAVQAPVGGTGGVSAAGGGGGGGLQADGSAGAQAPATVVSSVPQPVASAAAAATASSVQGDASASGDTNQIVDPKCVGLAAAASLDTGTAAPGPSCGPMQQPAELKRAEQQLQK